MTDSFVRATPDGSRVAVEVSATNPLPVTPMAGGSAASATNPLPVTSAGLARLGKQSFNRPADTTAYAIADLIANDTVAANVVPLSFAGVTLTGAGGAGEVTAVAVSKGGSATTIARVHFFIASPTVTNGDNGAIAVSNFDLDTYVGFVDVAVNDPVSGGMCGATYNLELQYALTSGDTLYALIECQAAYTPTSGGTWSVAPTLRKQR